MAGVGVILLVIAVVAIGIIAAVILGWGGFAGVRHREQAGERATEHDRPEHTHPTSRPQEHTHFVGSSDDN